MNNIPLNKSKNDSQREKKNITENDLRDDVKTILGENYISNILNYTQLDPKDFISLDSKIKNFIKENTGKNKITSTKMRKIYERIKKAQNLNELLLQIPFLAYMVGKEKAEARRALGRVYIIFKDLIENAKNIKDIENIKKFAEALVAYQRFFEDTGGENNE
jgi:CRISPR type III-A-associated protein Csm2